MNLRIKSQNCILRCLVEVIEREKTRRERGARQKPGIFILWLLGMNVVYKCV